MEKRAKIDSNNNIISQNYFLNFTVSEGAESINNEDCYLEIELIDENGEKITSVLNDSESSNFKASKTKNTTYKWYVHEKEAKEVEILVKNNNYKVLYNKTFPVDLNSTIFIKKEVQPSIKTSEKNYGTSTESIFTKNVLEIYDSDGDGRISRSEWDVWCANEGFDYMSNCDTDGDGYCSQSELDRYSRKFGY